MRFFSIGVMLVITSLPVTEALAQQAALNTNGELKVQGVDQLNTSVQRIDHLLRQFANIRWEYQFVQRNRLENTAEVLAGLGAEGWELVSVTVEEGYILKRAILPR